MPVPKTYGLEASFFFKQKSLDKVCKVLDLTREQFRVLAANADTHYRIKELQPGQKRRTETPQGVLRRVHDRLQNLLYRIEVPTYASALRRDVSYVGNAKAHAGDVHVLKTDIAKFYPSVKRHHVQHFLEKTLQMSPDLAALLSRIMTVSGFVPTGSPLSQTISFWSMYPMFQLLAKMSAELGITFTVWVDDLVFSSLKPISAGFRSAVTQCLKAAEMKPKYAKTVLYRRGEPKKVTGTILDTAGEARVPNGLRLSVVELAKGLEGKTSAPAEVLQRLVSKINSAQNIEPGIFKETKMRAMALTAVRGPKKPPRSPRTKRTYPKVF